MEREMITIEEFATRMGVGRSTVYTWLAEGKLVIGKQVMRIGRVVRVVWCDALLDDLLAVSARQDETPKTHPLIRSGRGDRSRLAFDLDAASQMSHEAGFPGRKRSPSVKSRPGRNTPREEVERGIHEK